MKNLKGNLLIVDDDTDLLNTLKIVLKYEFDRIITIKNPNQIQSSIQKEKPDVILLDMNFKAGVNTGNEGLFWLKKILEVDINAVVILITAYGDIELAVKAIKEGATDFVLKPWNNDKLISTLKTGFRLRNSNKQIDKLLCKQKQLNRDIGRDYNFIIGDSPEMKKVFSTIEKVAGTDANILLLGESGTGKELIAREIHRRSKRMEEVFISVDLGSVSESLFESELFGHTKGAFTDARENRTGRFEIASGGSLFLDEIGNISLPLQAKLLSAIQDRRIISVGSSQAVDIDIRLISATNKNLKKMVSDNLFREDLLFRINTIQINIPPLRDRGDDIVLLADFFLHKYIKKHEKPLLKLNGKALDKLLNYNWPGNIRELEHSVEKAIILSESDYLGPEDFLLENENFIHSAGSKTLNLNELEKNTIIEALERNSGNISDAAKELGIARPTLYRKMEKYDI
ncbi:sigma-54-dependent transcriptional regulator [Bacteroidota bacterium]